MLGDVKIEFVDVYLSELFGGVSCELLEELVALRKGGGTFY